jgi:hypothetical protein
MADDLSHLTFTEVMMLKKTLPILLLGFAMTAGCETLGLGGDEDTTSSDDRVSRDDRISREGDPSGRNRPGFEMRYPGDFDNGVPTGARLVREADGERVRYKTPHDGRLYIYDVDDRRVAHQEEMRDGDQFIFDARDERATMNDRNVNARINRDHRYRLYFVEDNARSSDLDR